MAWETSDRRSRLPKDWHRRRAIAKREAGGQCQQITNGIRCPAPGTDCDHIDRLSGDEQWNLQWLCLPHHKAKTQAEARAARRAKPRGRPTETHPGMKA